METPGKNTCAWSFDKGARKTSWRTDSIIKMLLMNLDSYTYMFEIILLTPDVKVNTKLTKKNVIPETMKILKNLREDFKIL